MEEIGFFNLYKISFDYLSFVCDIQPLSSSYR